MATIPAGAQLPSGRQAPLGHSAWARHARQLPEASQIGAFAPQSVAAVSGRQETHAPPAPAQRGVIGSRAAQAASSFEPAQEVQRSALHSGCVAGQSVAAAQADTPPSGETHAWAIGSQRSDGSAQGVIESQ
jgi:hypothetical protein